MNAAFARVWIALYTGMRSLAIRFLLSPIQPMAYDLRREPWIPWLRRKSGLQWGSPALLTDGLDDDPVVGLASPRADFDGALQEFLIGLLSAALQPAEEGEWFERWQVPPSPAELEAALAALPDAFNLDGSGPRFFQDLSATDLAKIEPSPIEQILIDAPGGQTARLNKDLFIKRDRVERMSRPAAAMALLTLQTYAPSGGKGHRTSLRGGGPLTTLVEPRLGKDSELRGHDQPLWRKLWANVETVSQWSARTPSYRGLDMKNIFPWLAPTKTSDPKTGSPTTAADAHPLQVYFGLPRRIRLEFGGPGRCDLTGLEDECSITGFRMRTYGIQYSGWKHPLSPYYSNKAGQELLPVHGQPGGVGWRDWLGLTFRVAENGVREPASAIAAFIAPAGRADQIGLPALRVQAFGYDMANMKARGWTEALLPAFASVDEEQQRRLTDTANRLTTGAGIAAAALLGAVRTALFRRPEEAPGDLSLVKSELWDGTAASFYDTMRVAAGRDVSFDALRAGCAAFARVLEAQAIRIFDRWCHGEGVPPDALRRLVGARYNLVMTLSGYSKLGEKLFGSLDVPLPGGGRAARAAKTRKQKEATA